MAKPLLLSIGQGKVQELVGGTNGYVPVWNASLEEWQSAPSPGGGGGGSGTVTSVTLDTGTTGFLVDTDKTTQSILTSGTFTLGGTLNAAHGGTGLGAPVLADAGKVLTASSSGTYTLEALPTSVGSITGTPNQITVSMAGRAATLALPQSIATTSSPEFAGLKLGTFAGLIRATAGTLAGGATVGGADFASQSPNTVFAAPDGAPGNPGFRGLVNADLPTVSVTKGGTGLTVVTTGKLLLGAGTSNMTELGGTTAGDVVKWDGSKWVAGSVPAITAVTASAAVGMGLTLGATTTGSSVAIALGGTLAAANGGTGRSYGTETGVVKVSGGTFQPASLIANADVSATAAIDRNKLAAGNVAYAVVVNNASGGMTELASAGTSGQVLTSNGTSAAPSYQSLPAVPYDVSGEVGGALTTTTEVFHFKAVRAWSMTQTGHQGGATTTPAANTLFDVLKNGVSIGTITFGSSGAFSSSISATAADRAFVAGDVLTVKTQSSVSTLAGPYFTFFGTVG